MVDRCTLLGQSRTPEVALFNLITRPSAGFSAFSQLSFFWGFGVVCVTKIETNKILAFDFLKAVSSKRNI